MVGSRENVENLLVQQKDGRDSHTQWAGGVPPVSDPCSQVWKSVWDHVLPAGITEMGKHPRNTHGTLTTMDSMGGSILFFTANQN